MYMHLNVIKAYLFIHMYVILYVRTNIYKKTFRTKSVLCLRSSNRCNRFHFNKSSAIRFADNASQHNNPMRIIGRYLKNINVQWF